MTAMQLSHPWSLAAASLGLMPRHRPSFLQQSCQRSWRAPRAASERPQPQRGHPQPAAATQPAAFDHTAAIEALLEGRQLSHAEAEEATASFIRAFLGESVVAAAAAERSWQRSRQRQQQRRQGTEQSSGSGGGSRGAARRQAAGGAGGRRGGGRGKPAAAPVSTPTVIDQAVEHLCSGQFDEAFLAGIPCEKLNWVIKVGSQCCGILVLAYASLHPICRRHHFSSFYFPSYYSTPNTSSPHMAALLFSLSCAWAFCLLLALLALITAPLPPLPFPPIQPPPDPTSSAATPGHSVYSLCPPWPPNPPLPHPTSSAAAPGRARAGGPG